MSKKRGIAAILVPPLLFALCNYLIVSLCGPILWSSVGYIFGNSVQTSLSVLFFIEGGITFAVGAVFASGMLETTVEGNFARLDPYAQKDVWKQRNEYPQKQYGTGITLLLVGALLLAVAFALALA